MKRRYGQFVTSALGAAALLLAPAPATADAAADEHAAIFKAAGFTKSGDRYIRCKEEVPTLSYAPGEIEQIDLNGDGQPEAWVKESSLFCYGNTGTAFVLLSKADGQWRVVLDAVGMPAVLPAESAGWPDIEVGGPGFGKFPVYRWNGKAYALRK